jgi:hypothetical protein
MVGLLLLAALAAVVLAPGTALSAFAAAAKVATAAFAALVVLAPWVLVGTFAVVLVLVATGGIAVRRRSASHVVAHLAVRGRGLYFRWTPDGACWQLRLRRSGRGCEGRGGPEPPPDSGVREPRPPLGPAPIAGVIELDSPH